MNLLSDVRARSQELRPPSSASTRVSQEHIFVHMQAEKDHLCLALGSPILASRRPHNLDPDSTAEKTGA